MALFGALKQPATFTSPTVVNQANTLYGEAALEIARLCNLHHASYGNTHMSVFWIHPIALSLYHLMDVDDTARFEEQITDLCIFARAMSRRWPFAMAILRMIQLTADRRQVTLPDQSRKLFEDFEKEDWHTREQRTLASMYPDPESAAYRKHMENADAALQNMGEFLDSMERLHLQDRGRSKDQLQDGKGKSPAMS
jgi:hypothetical protein